MLQIPPISYREFVILGIDGFRPPSSMGGVARLLADQLGLAASIASSIPQQNNVAKKKFHPHVSLSRTMGARAFGDERASASAEAALHRIRILGRRARRKKSAVMGTGKTGFGAEDALSGVGEAGQAAVDSETNAQAAELAEEEPVTSLGAPRLPSKGETENACFDSTDGKKFLKKLFPSSSTIAQRGRGPSSGPDILLFL